jgi:hypothetical protein
MNNAPAVYELMNCKSWNQSEDREGRLVACIVADPGAVHTYDALVARHKNGRTFAVKCTGETKVKANGKMIYIVTVGAEVK